MNKGSGNGLACIVEDDWKEHKQKAEAAYKLIGLMQMETKHLTTLPGVLSEMRRQTEILSNLHGSLLQSATGKDHIETKTAMMIFRIFGAVIAALVFSIVFLLTGQSLGLIKLLGH